MMMEIADAYIDEGDIVIFTPEIDSQSLSLYFSAAEAWLALDSDFSMFNEFSSRTKGNLVGSFASYASKKYKLWQSGLPAQPSGVYAQASFDERCDLKNFGRPFNMLADSVDMNNPISLDVSLYREEFIANVNEFFTGIRKRGASMYYSFPPMNRAAVTENSFTEISEFYGFVCDRFDFPVISDIEDYIMDKGMVF